MTTNDDFNRDASMNRATTSAAATAKAGIDAAGAGTDRALDAASDTLDDLRDATPSFRQGVDHAKGWLDEQAGRARDGIRTVRTTANDLSDQVIDYTRDEPVKALLIAAAVGAGLMGLLGLIARSDD